MASPSIAMIFASGSGHTEYVFDQIRGVLEAAGLNITLKRAEKAQSEDIESADIVILGSGTWNTGGSEGQLHPYMFEYLNVRLKDHNLNGKPVAFVSLGDNRYYFTTRCTEHFLKFAKQSNAKRLLPPLIIVNEPYGQEDKMVKWAEKFSDVTKNH